MHGHYLVRADQVAVAVARASRTDAKPNRRASVDLVKGILSGSLTKETGEAIWPAVVGSAYLEPRSTSQIESPQQSLLSSGCILMVTFSGTFLSARRAMPAGLRTPGCPLPGADFTLSPNRNRDKVKVPRQEPQTTSSSKTREAGPISFRSLPPSSGVRQRATYRASAPPRITDTSKGRRKGTTRDRRLGNVAVQAGW
jgi:hypothetical protein